MTTNPPPIETVNRRHSVGVVTTVLDGAAFIRATLQTVVEQSYQNWRCVVVDDGSSDESGAIAEEFAARDERFTVVHQANRGLPISRNVGYRALGPVDFVVFMDADDLWTVDALSILVNAADRTGAVGAHALAEFIDEKGAPIENGSFSRLGRERRFGRRGREVEDFDAGTTTFRHTVLRSTIFPPGVFLARCSAVEEIGLFDPRVTISNDWDFLTRLTRHGPLAFVDEVVLGYRRHASNMGASPATRQATALVRRKSFHSPENDVEDRRIVRSAWRASQATSARANWERLRSDAASRRYSAIPGRFARVGLAAGRFVLGQPSAPTRELGR